MKGEKGIFTEVTVQSPEEPCWRLDLGATLLDGGGTDFRVWAPKAKSLSVCLLSENENRVVRLLQEGDGYFAGTIDEVREGCRYFYQFDDKTKRPDPASRFQPEGVHGPSQVVSANGFLWRDSGWLGLPLEKHVIYELHVGTFTEKGTFESAIMLLDYLVELGVTAVELMPVVQFSEERNWGYDGTYIFAPQNSYGGPAGLKRLVDACHYRGLAVILDVVYNHLGPEGNYLHGFGPYFTDRYRTPWGDAINFDGPDSDPVRHYFIANALYWITEYHMDALRLDAVHGIFDFGARHILEELATTVHGQARRLERVIHVIAESDLNDARIIKPRHSGGYNLDAQWSDDFHHSLHALLTGEQVGYYQDFGRVEHLTKAITGGFVYDGCYSSYRRRRHGNSSRQRPACQFIVCAQNHDQTGNRMQGERLTALVSFESLKLAAGMLFLSPCVPLLFMGEEYGETAPFLYFIDHSDPALREAVRLGRKEGFLAACQAGEPPDPSDPATFARSMLDWNLRSTGHHRMLLSLYRILLTLRKETPALAALDRKNLTVRALEEERLLIMERWHAEERLLCLFSFAGETTHFTLPAPDGVWRKLLDSADTRWGGPGSALPEQCDAVRDVAMGGHSFALYRKEGRP